MNEGRAARCYLHARRHGMLATVSQKLSGYPFGSVLPYVLDHAARPVVLISRLAEHTRNIDADRRVSLLVHDYAADVQSAPRLTLIGDASRVAENLHALQARYLNYFPAAARLLALGDFSFYRVAPIQVRSIGGYGAMGWISGADYAPPATRLEEQEAETIARMNAEHARDLIDYCSRFKQRAVSSARVAGVDCDGFDLQTDGELVRFDFAEPAMDAGAVRETLAAMLDGAAGA